MKTPRAVRQWNMFVSSVRLGSKNHCVGKRQQPVFKGLNFNGHQIGLNSLFGRTTLTGYIIL